MELEKFQRQQGLKEQADTALADQLVMLSEIKPRTFRTRMQRPAYEGPAARRDAEMDLRSKYLRMLADILKNTGTPMGRLLREDPCNLEFYWE